MAHEIGKEAVTIERHQLVQCLIALSGLAKYDECGNPDNKWALLRRNLRQRLEAHDEKAKEKGWR